MRLTLQEQEAKQAALAAMEQARAAAVAAAASNSASAAELAAAAAAAVAQMKKVFNSSLSSSSVEVERPIPLSWNCSEDYCHQGMHINVFHVQDVTFLKKESVLCTCTRSRGF